MKKITVLIASLSISISILSAFPVVRADKIDTTVPPDEITQQETTLPENEVLPLFCDPQHDEINN